MNWRAMSKLHIEKTDGTFVDLNVDDLSDDDMDWLRAVAKRPWAMKTEAVEIDDADTQESDDEGSDEVESPEVDVDAETAQ